MFDTALGADLNHYHNVLRNFKHSIRLCALSVVDKKPSRFL